MLAFRIRFKLDNDRSTDEGSSQPPGSTANAAFLITYPELRYPQRGWLQQPPLDIPNPIQPETTPHFLGRYRQTVYARPINSRATDEGSSQPPGSTANSLFLVTYPELRYPQRDWLQQPARDVLLNIPEAGPHFIGRYRKDVYARAVNNRATDEESSQPPEAQPHFISRYRQTVYTRPINSRATDEGSSQPPGSTSNPLFLITYPNAGYPQRGLLQQPPLDIPPPVQPETNTHFLGRYRETRYQKLRPFSRSSDDTSSHPLGGTTSALFLVTYPAQRYPQRGWLQQSPFDISTPDSNNTHFLGRYRQAVYTRPIISRETDEASDDQGGRPHVIGRYRQTVYARFRYNSEDISTSSAVVATPEAAPHFIAKYRQTQYRRPLESRAHDTSSQPPGSTANALFLVTYPELRYPQRGWLQQPPTDVAAVAAQPEAPPHFLARYRQTIYPRLRSTAEDVSAGAVAPQPETNPHFLGRYNPAVYRRFRYFDLATDGGSTRADAPPHFIAKYRQTIYWRFRYGESAWDGTSSLPPASLPTPNDILGFRYKRKDNPYRVLTSWRQNEFTSRPPGYTPRTVVGYPAVPLWQISSPETWVNRQGDVLRTVLQGKQNITLAVTLDAGGATTTTIIDVRISTNTGIIPVPQTANAAAIASSIYVSAQQNGQLTLTHNANSNTDCTFIMCLIG